MTKKGLLFLLIKSLTRAEKRYVRLTASGNKAESNYLCLFDAIDSQDQSDESRIREVFKGHKFVKQLHVTKDYLTRLILRALRNYHRSDSVNSQLLNHLLDIEVLFNKELYDQCLLTIEKAQLLAAEFEKLPLLSEVLSWKRRLLVARYGATPEEVPQILNLERETIEQMGQVNTYWDFAIRSVEYAKKGKRFLNNPYIAGEDRATALQAKILRYHLLHTHYMFTNRPVASEKAVSDLISLLEDHPKRIHDDPGPFITAISNKVGLLLHQKRWKEIPPLIRKIREVPARYQMAGKQRITVRLWVRVFNVELELYRDSRQLDKAVKLIDEIHRFLEVHGNVVPRDYVLLFTYQFASIHFLRKDYPQALFWLNQILNTNFGAIREDVQACTRLLLLTVHFELGNIIVLRYAVDACRRYLKKTRQLQAFHARMLSLFSRLSQYPAEDHEDLLLKAYDEMALGKALPGSETVLDYFDFKSWLKGRTLSTVTT
jgi:hypothetical protein